jgi:hypothetical protein
MKVLRWLMGRIKGIKRNNFKYLFEQATALKITDQFTYNAQSKFGM